jgi:hypothetical protein
LVSWQLEFRQKAAVCLSPGEGVPVGVDVEFSENVKDKFVFVAISCASPRVPLVASRWFSIVTIEESH